MVDKQSGSGNDAGTGGPQAAADHRIGSMETTRAAYEVNTGTLSRPLRATLQLMLDGLPEQAALLTADGTIVAANDAWKRLAEYAHYDKLRIGGNYLDFNRDRAAEGHPDAADCVTALIDIAAGRRSHFQRSFRTHGPLEGMTFKVRIVSIPFGGESFVFVSRYDVTEVARLRRQRRSLGNRLVHAQGTERRRISRELRDSTEDLLAELQSTLTHLKQAPADARSADVLAECDEVLVSVLHEIRVLAFTSEVAGLGEEGLAAALEALVASLGARSGIIIELELDDSGDAASAAIDTLYRVAQEALANVYRHASATRILVRLSGTEDDLVLTIQDDGIGIERARRGRSSGPGVGISGMQERARELGGRVSVRALDRGTVVTATLPRIPR